MANGSGWSGPSREYRGQGQFSPLQEAMRSASAARAAGSGGGVRAARGGGGVMEDDSDASGDVPMRPGLFGPGDFNDPGESASEGELERAALQPRSFQVDNRPYRYDPRIAIAQEVAKQRASRDLQLDTEQKRSTMQDTEKDQRVQRLVTAGYSQREAVRQVWGGPRTVEEEQEVLRTRSADQMSRDKMIQSEIDNRATQARTARSNLAQLLEASKHGDRQATLQLRANQSLLNDATRAHSEAVRAQQRNALGFDMGGAEDPNDASLNAAISEHLSDVESTGAARKGAIAGVRRAASGGAPGAEGVTPEEGAAFLGVRQPTLLNDASGDGATGISRSDPMAAEHRKFRSGTLPNQSRPGGPLKPQFRGAPQNTAPKPSADQSGAAAKDAAYHSWLSQKGYDMTGVSHPDDEEEQFDDSSSESSEQDDGGFQGAF